MIRGFVPQLHVASVARSLDFYAQFGFECVARFGPEGAPFWARMKGEAVDMMLVLADGPVDAGVQAVLFYLYTSDLEAVRSRLLEAGVPDGGAYTGQPDAPMLFSIAHPDYLPEGMMRVHDLDGYVLLIAQQS